MNYLNIIYNYKIQTQQTNYANNVCILVFAFIAKPSPPDLCVHHFFSITSGIGQILTCRSLSTRILHLLLLAQNPSLLMQACAGWETSICYLFLQVNWHWWLCSCESPWWCVYIRRRLINLHSLFIFIIGQEILVASNFHGLLKICRNHILWFNYPQLVPYTL